MLRHNAFNTSYICGALSRHNFVTRCNVFNVMVTCCKLDNLPENFILELMIAGGFTVPWGAQDRLKVKAGEIFWSLVRWRAECSGCEEVEQAAAERCRHSIRPRRALTPSLHPFTAPHTVPLILWHPRAYEAQQHFSMPPKLPHYRAPYIPIPIPTIHV